MTFTHYSSFEFPVGVVHFSVEYTHVTVLLVSVREHSPLPRKRAFHVSFHIGHGLKQFQIAEMKETNVKIILLLIHDGDRCR